MPNSDFNSVVAAVEAASDPAFGFTGRTRRDRRGLRLRKKFHQFPFVTLFADLTVHTTRDVTADDARKMQVFSSEQSSDGIMSDILVETAEKTGCGIVVGTPFADPRRIECSAEASAVTQSLRAQFDALTAFAAAILEIPTVTKVEMTMADGWHLNANDVPYPYGEFVFV